MKKCEKWFPRLLTALFCEIMSRGSQTDKKSEALQKVKHSFDPSLRSQSNVYFSSVSAAARDQLAAMAMVIDPNESARVVGPGVNGIDLADASDQPQPVA